MNLWNGPGRGIRHGTVPGAPEGPAHACALRGRIRRRARVVAEGRGWGGGGAGPAVPSDMPVRAGRPRGRRRVVAAAAVSGTPDLPGGPARPGSVRRLRTRCGCRSPMCSGVFPDPAVSGPWRTPVRPPGADCVQREYEAAYLLTIMISIRCGHDPRLFYGVCIPAVDLRRPCTKKADLHRNLLDITKFKCVFEKPDKMGKAERIKLIRQIEHDTGSRILVYFTGDQPTFETKIGNDAIPLFYEHLEKIKAQEKITLMLYKWRDHQCGMYYTIIKIISQGRPIPSISGCRP